MSLRINIDDVVYLTDNNNGSATCYPPYNYVVITYATSQTTAHWRDEYKEYILDSWNTNHVADWEKTAKVINEVRKLAHKNI